MAIAPTRTIRGTYEMFSWTLTAADQVADPTPPMAFRNEKTIDVYGASGAAGFNGATLVIEGTLEDLSDDNFKTLNTIPDTTVLSFTAAAARPMTILPNVARLRPRVSAGTVGATGVTIVLLATKRH